MKFYHLRIFIRRAASGIDVQYLIFCKGRVARARLKEMDLERVAAIQNLLYLRPHQPVYVSIVIITTIVVSIIVIIGIIIVIQSLPYL